VSEAIDLIGQYQDAGVHLLINSGYRNEIEAHELSRRTLCCTLHDTLTGSDKRWNTPSSVGLA
jgi:hypothetical protein